jgi:signal recognition particle GTPase
MKPGLYAAINAKQKRIAAGSGEKMNKVGSKAAPSAKDFKQAAKTAKKKPLARQNHTTCQMASCTRVTRIRLALL